MGERRIKGSWLDAFYEWTLERSEAPTSFIFWAGAFTISSVLKRKVCFPKKLMGSYSIYPNLYVLFVGPPGGPRKTTTMNYSHELLHELKVNLEPMVNFSSTAMSDSKLVEVLSQTNDGTITIHSGEFSSFVNVSKEAMFDLLTDLFEGKVSYEYSTRMHGVELVEKPCVNLLAATTPSWISSASIHLTGGGFASRIIFVFENEVRQRRMYYDNLNWKEFEELKTALRHDLHVINKIEGDFAHASSKVRNMMEDWYRAYADTVEGDERVAGYYQRKHIHVHKVAMILSVAERDDKIITEAHFNKAVEILEETEKKMPRALSSIGRNPFASDLEAILDYINMEGSVTKKQLIKRFYHNLESRQLEELVSSLVVMGDLVADRRGKDTVYSPAK